ncbi:hypothetical protein VSS74_20785 [Conexibacter stalactiti]|uniref:Uncharacterized protein n=1 Tax=Conexibacter stalactiti TaxID=1940611 RepID=A0ABU4HWA4_9ACTN|nr:hypothetical protein [Conexibacter stalactiti]MDW5596795.1 hypothetical protein [Conexibacter stalactiti]MEC5037437.1 hypothetical protein [Conexibacter stalactiti]
MTGRCIEDAHLGPRTPITHDDAMVLAVSGMLTAYSDEHLAVVRREAEAATRKADAENPSWRDDPLAVRITAVMLGLNDPADVGRVWPSERAGVAMRADAAADAAGAPRSEDSVRAA